jgi:Rad52/22 family double-strand break repair protein
MGFSRKQLTALKRELNGRVVRTREAHGRQFSYLEGWYVIAEANRIFGYDGWSRETLESKCFLTRESRGTFLAIYIARVRITVQANGATIIREAHGSGEGHGTSAAEVHDVAVKAAETDATKRALVTFGRPFGLELYRSDKDRLTGLTVNTAPDGAEASHAAADGPPLAPDQAASVLPNLNGGQVRSGLHPDDTTPIPRPSRYYGRRQGPTLNDHFRNERQQLADPPAAPPLAPATPDLITSTGDARARIDKSALALTEPKRLRDKHHLKFVASQSCLVCGRQPCDPHHLRFAQPRAIGMKVSDEFTVPLCRGHHRQLHQAGNEIPWWKNLNINALEIARGLWEQTHPKVAVSNQVAEARPGLGQPDGQEPTEGHADVNSSPAQS